MFHPQGVPWTEGVRALVVGLVMVFCHELVLGEDIEAVANLWRSVVVVGAIWWARLLAVKLFLRAVSPDAGDLRTGEYEALRRAPYLWERVLAGSFSYHGDTEMKVSWAQVMNQAFEAHTRTPRQRELAAHAFAVSVFSMTRFGEEWVATPEADASRWIYFGDNKHLGRFGSLLFGALEGGNRLEARVSYDQIYRWGLSYQVCVCVCVFFLLGPVVCVANGMSSVVQPF